MYLKKSVIVLMSILLAIQPFMNMGCAEQPTEPPSDVQNQDSAIEGAEQQSQMYEAMIAKMDGYVTMNNDGTYSIDYQGFLNANSQSLTAEEQKVADGLNKGISLVNAQILQERKEPGTTALGVACWNYWWGRRCCYWGAEGWQIASLCNAGAFLPPPFSYIVGGLGIILSYYMSVYGGFCLNQSWVGGQWITKP